MPKNKETSAAKMAPLDREEYVEQAHFFSTLGERIAENVPAQEVMKSVREEVLATTKLPMAIDFLLAELVHEGVFAPAMRQLSHYFTPFQAFVIGEAENERSRFDFRIGLAILSREATYRVTNPSRQGLFLYQFESLCRNRLGYDRGLTAVAGDPIFDPVWRDWILSIRHQVGMVDIADLIYVHSEHYRQRTTSFSKAESKAESKAADTPEADRESAAPLQSEAPVLFGEREGRIALANRRKDPLYLFASLHRQLDYPDVPQPKKDEKEALLPQVARRLGFLEKRVQLVEEEQRGGIDLTKFYGPQPPESPPE